MCGKCKKSHRRDQSIYRCIDCHTNLQCLVPYGLKSKCHIHPLTLKACFVEDASGEYYCDVCEEERDSKEDVYYCQECDGFFVAHIQCALAKVEEVLERYGPSPYSRPRPREYFPEFVFRDRGFRRIHAQADAVGLWL
ncbi:hypothetical protein PTKIN_Ptkin01aG0358900 [Pterospermum kingtungense]